MATIAIKKSEWDSLTDPRREGLCRISGPPHLGVPATVMDGDQVEWCIFDDHRITSEQVALVAALVENPDQIPVQETEGNV